MTPDRWTALCESLSRLPAGPALDEAIAAHRLEVATWPAATRVVPATSPWLSGLFEGRLDPRLELAGWASLEQVLRRQPTSVRHGQMFGIVKALAARLDPAFDPPDVVLSEANTIVSAYGCGGGQETWTRGDATHRVRFTSNASESPSDGMRSEDAWTAEGLAPMCALTIATGDFADDRKLSAAGPCPAVLELAPAWSAVVRGAGLDEVRQVLAESRVPWHGRPR